MPFEEVPEVLLRSLGFSPETADSNDVLQPEQCKWKVGWRDTGMGPG